MVLISYNTPNDSFVYASVQKTSRNQSNERSMGFCKKDVRQEGLLFGRLLMLPVACGIFNMKRV
jgi:hypothetical protein